MTAMHNGRKVFVELTAAQQYEDDTTCDIVIDNDTGSLNVETVRVSELEDLKVEVLRPTFHRR